MEIVPISLWFEYNFGSIVRDAGKLSFKSPGHPGDIEKGTSVSFRDNLLRLRNEHGMTQEQLAALVGVSRQSVAKWEADRSYPEMDKLIKMTGIFGCTLDELVMGPTGADAADDMPVISAGESAGACSAEASSEHASEAFETSASEPATDSYGYDVHMRAFAMKMACGVGAIILGVALMMLAEAVLAFRAGCEVENPAIVVPLFGGIIVGLALIIPAAMGHSTFMREHPVVRDFYSLEDKRQASSRLAGGIVGGIALVFAGIVIVNLCDGNGQAQHVAVGIFGVAILLACIALAVWCFVYFGIMFSRVNVGEYNKDSLDSMVEACGEGNQIPDLLMAQLSPAERQLLFDVEGVDGTDPDQVRSYFVDRRRKGKLASGICSIIMIVTTIVGLCLLFGVPVQSPYFWMAWVVGGLSCAIVGVVVSTFVK